MNLERKCSVVICLHILDYSTFLNIQTCLNTPEDVRFIEIEYVLNRVLVFSFTPWGMLVPLELCKFF